MKFQADSTTKFEKDITSVYNGVRVSHTHTSKTVQIVVLGLFNRTNWLALQTVSRDPV